LENHDYNSLKERIKFKRGGGEERKRISFVFWIIRMEVYLGMSGIDRWVWNTGNKVFWRCLYVESRPLLVKNVDVNKRKLIYTYAHKTVCALKLKLQI